MRKFIKWFVIVAASLVILLIIAFQLMTWQTKKHSPEQTEELKKGDIELSVLYSQPSKKDREIFGALVPYGQVWRTGANEPTTFTTNKAITFGDIPVEAGTYTLWTIPNETEWTVILNKKHYDWGMSFGGESPRLADEDAAAVTVPVQLLESVEEKFIIDLQEEPFQMVLKWDQTMVSVDLK